MEKEVICQYCGKPFVSKSGRAKYCSALCRTRAFYEQTRKEATVELAEEKRAEAEDWKRQTESRAKRHREEIREKAENGDPLAVMMSAKPFSVEYFKGFQEYELGFSPDCVVLVNGVSVQDPDFPEAAAFAVKEDGVCSIQREGK